MHVYRELLYGIGMVQRPRLQGPSDDIKLPLNILGNHSGILGELHHGSH